MASFMNIEEKKNASKGNSGAFAAGIEPCHFPRLDGDVSGKKRVWSVNVAVTKSQELHELGATEASAVLRAAWGLVLGCYTGLENVCFGYQNTHETVCVEPVFGMSVMRLELKEDVCLSQLADNDCVPVVGFDQAQFNTALLFHSNEIYGASAVTPFMVADFEECSICLQIKLSPDNLDISLQFWSSEMSGQQALSVASTFDKIITEIITRPSMILADLSYFSARDEESVRQWNSGPLEEVPRCIHDIFHDQASYQPDAEAICAHDGIISYGELDKLSSCLAHYLVDVHNIGPEVFVPVCFDKSAWNVVAMLAVLKSGAAFVPLDPKAPLSRLETLSRKVRATTLLTSANYVTSLSSVASTIIAIDGQMISQLPPKSPRSKWLIPHARSNNQAYLIFTSGTTGEPKGTVIEHGAFCSSANAHGQKMFTDSNSRVLQFAAHTFDASLQEILTTLMFGGTVCIPDEHTRLNNITAAIRDMKVNWACLTPSFVDFISPSDVPGLKTLILVGEPMSQGHIATWSPHARLINGYGPSECSVAAVANSNISLGTHPQDIGHAIGVHVWIVDPNNHHSLVPVGCVGELLIQGPTLARGYLDDPEKTAECFIQNPRWASAFIHNYPQCRFYKTGDLVRQHHDGSLRFIGRKDNQVKVHGQRVELGEIEHHVSLNETVKHGLVLLPKGGPFKGRLVSIISLLDSTARGSDVGSIRVIQRQNESKDAQECLSTLLPSYMVPSIWLTVESIPLLASGKLDRKMVARWLHDMSEDSYRQVIDIIESNNNAAEASGRPATEIETQLRMAWSRVLNLSEDQISLNRSFLSMGGDSISAMQVMGHCSKKNISLTVQDILRAKSITELARCVKSVHSSLNHNEVTEQLFDLTPIQQMYFQLPNQGIGHFNQSFFLRVTRRIQKQDLRHAIETVIKRHSMLRSRFSKSADGTIRQRVTESITSSYRIKIHKIFTQSQATPAISDSQKALNPFEGPLFAADLFDVGGNDQLLFMVGHHLVIDLVSWRIILEEIEELLLDPSKSSSTEKPLPFQTWCQLQTEHATKMDLERVLPSIDIPPGDPAFWGMKDEPNTYGSVTCEGFEIDATTTSLMLTECHNNLHTEPIDILLSALIYSFAQAFTDRPVPALYTEGHGREPSNMAVNLSRTVGWFTTMYPVCIPASASLDPIETVTHVKDFRRRVPDNGRPYFASRCLTDSGRDRFGQHFLELTFNYLGQYQQLEREDALLKPISNLAGEARGAGGVADVGQNTPRFGLFEISAVIIQGKLRFSFTFNRNISHQDRIRRWISECNQAVGLIATRLMQLSPQVTLTDFPLLSLTYGDLEKITKETLPRIGVSDISEIEGIYPCSSIQEGILLSQSRSSGLYEDHVICQLKLSSGGKADTTRLAAAWEKVVQRHPTLRTLFFERVGARDGIYDQVVLKHVPTNIVLLDCSGESEALRLLDTGSDRNYIMAERPPHRFTICHTSNSKIFCKVEISHTIIDGESMAVIFRDLALAYEGLLPEGSGPLYSDYIGYLQKKPADEGIDHWKSYLADVIPCEFPVLNDGLSVRKQLHSLRLDFDNMQFLEAQRFCEGKDFTFSNILHVAWALTLRCYTGRDDICFGYLSSGRDAPLDRVEDAVGPYINMLACRLKIAHTSCLTEVLQQVQEDYAESLPYHHTSLAEVQHALCLSGTPIFDTLLSYRRMRSDRHREKSNVSFIQCCPTYDPTEYTISINVESTEYSAAIDLAYWTDRISSSHVANIGGTFLHCIQNIICQSTLPVGQLDFVSDQNRQQIWNWNSSIPETINECVHQIIEKQTRLNPRSLAICAWDVEFCYADLDAAATKLANHLAKFNVGPETFVPVCFEKSAWTIVAMFAVLKAGAAAVPLDPKHPREALELRIRNVEAQVILTAPSLVEKLEGMAPHVISVCQSTLDQLPLWNGNKSCGPAIPTNPCFVIYTSGSTGQPKGVVLEHRAVVTSANTHGSHQGIGPGSRVLQFSAYTFDVSLAEMFTTLMRGGCVCVPSESDRYNDLAGAINEMGVNFMDLTPTVASLLQPSDVPGVKGLCLAGEAITKENIKVWGPALDLQCCYGPSECTIYCTWNGDLEGSSEPTNIGRSIGSVSWLVDPSDHNVLQPIGCIGEILVEGPILARGYLNDPKKTFESFIFDPKWAQGGGRRMYKTGDLGRYNSDGTITYLGRRDTQVKLNGQRLELGEIEYHVKANLPAGAHSAVELVRIGDPQTGIKALATFVSFGSSSSVPASRQDWQLLPFTDSLQSIAENLAVALTKSLPGYMVPTLFLPTPSMPMTASGKLDRRQLRKQCESLSQEQAAIYRLGKQSSRALSTTMEVKFQGLWESVLKLKPGSVKADDTFFQLGGDSIGAMRLVTAARLQGISISVAEILQNPRLADFAAKAGSAVVPDDTLNSGPQAFSLLSPSELLTKHIASECRVSMESIQDAYPCSPLQEGLIALSTKSPGAYVAQNVYQLPSDINLDRFKKAWEMVFEHESMLRTRVVHTKEHGFLQVVVRDSPSWNRVSSEEELDRLRKLPPHNGGILSQYTIVGDNTDHPQFVWTAHHALYDSWCIPLLFRKVEALYNDIQSVDVASNVPYSRFIKYLSEINVTASDDFWKARLSGTTAVSFPPLPHPAYQVRATSISKYNISLSHGSRRNITLPSIIRAAWALVIGVYSGSAEDVVFGEILSGRDASVPGIADMVGPTITTVPTRIRIGPDVSIAEFLEDVQAQSAEMLPFQHSGLQHIKRISDDTAIACSFQNLLSITVNNGEMPNSLCEFQSSGTAGSNFSSYPLAILCGVEDGGAKIGIDCHYDEGAISIWQVERILGQFEFFLHRLNSNTGMNEKLGQISILNSTDQVTIQNWNSAPLKHVDKCIHDIIESQVDLQPASKTAIDSYDISLTYSELGQLSTRLAQYIVEQRLECDIIPFCFEKSAWAIVAMLAVMKSGRAFVPLDPAAPLARLRDITGDTEANFILCSAGYQALCQSLVPCAVVVNQQTIKRLPSYNCKLPRCNSSSPAYVIFTSGSTGKPKGTIVEHAAFCMSAAAHGPALRMRSTSRVLQFAAYTFDVSLMEIFTTLTLGGCVCIPDEESRLNNISGFITERGVTWAGLTPSFVQLIDPLSVPSLRTLVLGGEAMSRGDIANWADKVDLINAYGPSECAITTTANPHITLGTNPANIGYATGSRTWVVDPGNHNRLAPVGSVGELIIEGPLARGYLKNDTKTAEVFIENPEWTITNSDPISVPKRRMYKTGDLVRYLSDGSLVFHKRKDTQTKVHGQRLELGEVEHFLRTDSAIQHALAIIPSMGHCKSRLVAILSLQELSTTHQSNIESGLNVVSQESSSIHVSDIRERLCHRLPAYMIPSHWIVLKKLPFLPSGKLDRRQTASWVECMSDVIYRRICDVETQDDSTEVTGIEKLLRIIWGETLNLPPDQIGLRQSFLHLGGDSISAMQVMSRCRADGMGVTVQDILQSKSISELASCITSTEQQWFEEDEVDKVFDLSPIQKLYFESVRHHGAQFNQSTVLRFTKRIDVDIVRRAVDTIVQSHSMLRARFSQNEGSIWQQRIVSHTSESYQFTARDTTINHLAALVERTQKSLDIEHGPVFAADLFNVGQEQVISLIAHHLVIDVVSWRIILQDLEDILGSGRVEALGSFPFQAWCSRQADHAQQMITEQVFHPEGIPVADIAYWGMENKPNVYGDVITESFNLHEATSTQLLGTCHASRQTEPVDIFIATVLYSLHSVFSDRGVTPTIYNEGHGREPWADSGLDLSRTVGWFTTICPLYLPSTVKGDITLLDTITWIKDLRKRIPDKGREYFAYRLLTEAGNQQFASHWPMEVSFNYLGKLQQLERKEALLQPFSGASNTGSDIGCNMPRFSLLDISTSVAQGNIKMSFSYNKSMKHQDRIRQLILECQSSLEAAAQILLQSKPQRTLSDFPLLPLSYNGVEKLAQKLPMLGVSSLEDIEDAYPCSPMQQNIILAQQKNPELYACLFVFEVRSGEIGSQIDAELFSEAWHEVVHRHASMRTVFIDGVCIDGQVGQVVLKKAAPRLLWLQCQESEVVATLAKQKPIQFSDPVPPHRLILCKTNSGRVVCKFEISHAISDGTSQGVIFGDLSKLYQSKVRKDVEFALPAAPLYSDYISYVSQTADTGIKYWKSYLDGIQPCRLPPINDGTKAKNTHHSEVLELMEFSRLRSFCAENSMTLANVLQLAWGLILRLYTGSEEVCFGYLTSGRDSPIPGLQDAAVGAFINMLVCRINFAETSLLSQALQHIQTSFINGMQHQSCSLGAIQHELELSGTSLFNTAFTFQRRSSSESAADQELVFDMLEMDDPSEYDIAVNAVATDSKIGVSFSYWTDCLSKGQAENMAKTFEHILNTIISCPKTDQGIQELDFFSDHSLRQVMDWNSTLPMSVERRIQDLILEQTFTRPFTTQAVCSWDAAFTYTELDDISTSLALDLMEFGVTPEVYVPICFEKSAWAVVSILAVLKAGGAFVPLDPSHPESRLKHIIDDVGATLVLCSQRYQGIFVDIAKKTFIVDHHSIGERHENRTLSQLPAPTPTNSALVLFTSGTTGLPKGTIIEHGAFCTSAIYHSKGMHIYSTSRVFQFASLTFDAGIMEILTTLIVGGTICIPSDHERMNDIPGAMKRMKVNWMFSTPSLASTLVPESLPTLKTLIMGGEAISAADILKWKGKLCLIDGYGPSETTICATTNMLLDEHGIEVNTGATNIGKAVTGRAWVVDPRHHDKLMPVGAIGELVIESRGVARGYLNNKPKTAAAFLDNPLWLQDVEPRQRVYKTGDLVRYNSNGSLNFISRKDTQIKLNGQRIELSEIEHHVKTNLSHDMDSTVELVSPGDGTNALAVFFCLKNTAGVDSKTPTDDEIALPMCDTAQNVARDLDISLATSLPAYMIPTLFIPLTQIPLTKSSGKLDRARLRRIVETLPTSILAAYRLASDVNKRAPSTPMEKTLQQLWESVLNVTPPGSIGADDSFFRLGGDSITAMKLAVAARAEGISLAVVDIFRTPKLSEMAAQCTSTNLSEEDTWAEPEDFALLDKSGSVEELLSEVAHECHVRKELVQDAYPCSPLQEALITLSTKESGAYVAHHIFRLSADIDIQRFQSAWQHVVDGVDILRTRVVHMRSSDFVQVVLNEQKITWNAAQSIQDAKDKGINLPASNGGTLSRYTIVNPTDLQNRFFVWSIHHALYDGWSLLAVFKMVQAAYFDKFPPLPRNSYASFIRYLLDMDMEASDDFWKSKLSGASPLQFPQIQTADCGRARQIEAFSYTSSVSQRPANRDVTIPSIIRAAWSLIVAAYSGSDDVVFGEILAGRNIPVSGITEIMGPAIAIVPTRIQINKQATLASFLQQVHKMATDVIPYQHTGLQRIKRLDADAALACDFQNLLVIQPAHEDSEAALWEPHDDGSVQSNFSTYPLIIECNAGTNEIGITAFYNKEVISSWVVERLILQLDHVLGQLSTLPASGAASKVGEIEIFSNQDKKTVQRWNGNDLECIDRCLHEAFEQQALSQPNAPAICAWDGELTYRELMEHATKLAHHLVTLGVGPEVFVPICMDRSAWVLVAILGILMAGGAYVPLDPSSPMSRHEGMIQDVKARLILCSPKYKDRYTGTLEKSFVIDESVITRLAKAPHPMRSRAMSSNAAYVIFTSGSTGRPKGVVIEHRSIATNIWSWRDRIMIKSNSRVFHFGSLAFDASVMELFGALSFGACLCIPSEESRLNNVSETIDSFKATWVFLTPSLANVINPLKVPSVEVLLCGGEALSAETILKWAGKVTLINLYGPTETAVLATGNSRVGELRDSLNIGHAFPSGRTWVTDPGDHNCLAPIGCVGELLLEGPILAREYINNPDKTAEAFITNPAWAASFGDMTSLSSSKHFPSERRLYKTGDLVKYSSDGTLIFIGRKDHQVKLRGQRIELGEIEHSLAQDPRVKHGLVILPKSGPFMKRLVAVVSLNDLVATARITKGCELVQDGPRAAVARSQSLEAQNCLSDKLPLYMVPTTWLVVEAIPISTSGKLERRVVERWLESVDAQSYDKIITAGAEENDRSPATETTKLLQQIIARVLNLSVRDVKLQNSFLSLGGDSITAMQVVALCRKENIQFTLPEILRNKSIHQLALICRTGGDASYQDEKLDQNFDLSPIQQMYFESQSDMDQRYGKHFNQSFLLKISRPLQTQELKRAIETLVDQHSMLRARFIQDSSGRWQQRIIQDITSSYHYQFYEIGSASEIVPYVKYSQSSLNILQGPLLSVCLFDITGSDPVIFLAANHLVVDMVSWRILLQDLEEILTTGSLAASKPLSFQSWCAMQVEHSEKQSTGGITDVLPFKVPAANIGYWSMDGQSNNYGDVECLTFSISEALTASAMGECHSSLRTEPVDVFLSAIAHSFSRTFSDRATPTIFNENHGREPWDSSIDLSRTVGWFTTLYPVHVEVDMEDDDVLKTVRRMKDVRHKVPNNGRSYFAHRYLTAEGRSEFKDHDGPMEILFNYLGRMQQLEHQDSLLQHWNCSSNESDAKLMSDAGSQTARLALIEISVVIIKDRIQFSFVFNRKMKNQQAIHQWISDCKSTLEETVASLMRIKSEYQLTLSDLPLLPISYDGLRKLVKKTLPSVGIKPQAVEDIYPCAPMQEGMLLSQLRDPEIYQFRAIYEVTNAGPVDARRLVKAWQQVVNQHAALRTVFVDSLYRGAVFNQVVVKHIDKHGVWVKFEDTEALEKLESFALDERYYEQPRLPHQFTVCETSTGRVYFKLEMNHAVMDGGSLPIMFRDLAAAYEGHLQELPRPLYSDYIAYLKRQSPETGVRFWKTYLQGARPCHFPVLNTSPPTKKRLNFAKLSFDRFPELRALCQEKNITLANAIQAAWAVCLRSYTGHDDVCFGYLSSGRDIPVSGIQDTVGPLINMLVCRVNFARGSSLGEIIQKVQSDYLQSLDYQHCSLAQIQHDLDLDGGNLFNTAVSIQGDGAAGSSQPLSISFTPINAMDPNEYAITLNIGIAQAHEGAVLRYWTDILSDEQAESLVCTLAKVLDSIVSKPQELVAELELSNSKATVSQPNQWDQPTDLRLIVKECVQEILGQILKSGAVTTDIPQNIDDLMSPKNLQTARPITTTQATAEYSQIATFPVDADPDNRGFDNSKADPHISQKMLLLWSEFLQIPETSIRNTDSFFKLGGDSITAMQLVGAAREEGLSITVADLFRNPVFADMVEVIRTADDAAVVCFNGSTDRHNGADEVIKQKRTSMLYKNFSLLQASDVSSFLQENVCPKIKLFRGGIVDVLPCTDFQALSVTGSLLESRWMLNYFYLEGRGSLDIKRLRQSINRVVNAFEILRTVFIPYNGQFFQVILRKLNPVFNVELTDNLQRFTSDMQQRDREAGPRLGESYLQFTVAKLRNSEDHRIIIRISHAQYDGVCLPRIVNALHSAYHDQAIPPTPSFSGYVRDAVGKTTNTHYEYWTSLLEGSRMIDIVPRRGPNYSRGPNPPTVLKRIVKLSSLSAENITPAIVIKAAWSLVLAKISSRSDIIFGNVISGRNASISGLESIVGPCVNTIPVRATFQPGWTALHLMRHLQDQQVANMPYESLGFREIIKHCTDWPDWTNFTTVCQHQNIQQSPEIELGQNKYIFGGVGSQDDFADFTVLSVPQGDDDIEISLIFGLSNIHMTEEDTEAIFSSLCQTAEKFSKEPHTPLPSPQKLCAMPQQRHENAAFISARRMSSSLDALPRKYLLVYSDVLTRGWRQILGEVTIDPESSFFDLGGDIMGLAQLASLLEQEGFKLRLEDLVLHPVLIEQLALLARLSSREEEEGDHLLGMSGEVLGKKGYRKVWGIAKKLMKPKARPVIDEVAVEA